MADVLAEISGVKITIRTAGIITAALTLMLFTLLRIAMNKKAAAETRTPARWADGLGFGLLPAAAVWKIFESMYAAAGRAVIEPLPMIPWMTAEGRFVPANIETAAALICFAGICIWLMIRKEELTGTADMLMVSLCLWSGIRAVTESFREAPENLLRYAYCAAILACLLIWTVKQRRQPHAKQRIAGNWLAAILCTAIIVVTASGTLSVGSEIGDLAVTTGCAGLMVLATLLCGSDQRKTLNESAS